MDYYLIIISGLAGGLSAFLNNYFQKKYTNKKSKFIGAIIGATCFISIITIGQIQAVKSPLMHMFDKNYEIKMIIEEKMKPIAEIPEVRKKIKELNDKDQISTYMKNLTAKGIKRLSIEKLQEWNNIRLEMANKSEDLCAGMWNGKIGEADILSAMSKLSKDSIDKWMQLSIHATKLQISKVKYPAISQDDFINGIKAIAQNKTDNEQIRMGTVLTQGLNASKEDACWMMKVILNDSQDIDLAASSKMIRYLSSIL